MFRQHNVGGGALQQEGPGSGSSYVDSGCKIAVCVCVCVSYGGLLHLGWTSTPDVIMYDGAYIV